MNNEGRDRIFVVVSVQEELRGGWRGFMRRLSKGVAAAKSWWHLLIEGPDHQWWTGWELHLKKRGYKGPEHPEFISPLSPQAMLNLHPTSLIAHLHLQVSLGIPCKYVLQKVSHHMQKYLSIKRYVGRTGVQRYAEPASAKKKRRKYRSDSKGLFH